MFSCTLHEQLKLVKENYWKKTCSSYTRARKATKELVKENLIFCAGLKRSNPSIEHLTARNQSSSTLGQKSDLVELAITSGFLREKVSFSLILRNYTGFLLNLIFGILK